MQRLLRAQIEIVSPDTLVIAEEFGDWSDSQRRIDLLGLDRDANLVVIELKRGHAGIAPTAIANAIVPWQPLNRSFRWVNGTFDSAQFLAAAPQQASIIGRVWDATRYFTAGGDLTHADSRTYAFSNQWGQGTEEAMQALIRAFPVVDTSVSQTAGED